MAQLPEYRSPELHWFLGSLTALFVLVGVTLLFWTAAHPSPSVGEEAGRAIGTWGYYSTEGGHDPVRRPGNTRDELKFRGSLTPPSEAPGP
jgi:hypothetical protein